MISKKTAEQAVATYSEVVKGKITPISDLAADPILLAKLETLKTSGVKYDTDKVQFELLPGDALRAIAVILTFGAKKYSARNWELGMDWSRVFGALQRHLWAWWGGENTDPETGKSHLWHAGCCIVFLIAYEERGVGKDDRPNSVVSS